ncbi:MAG TPA: hypothetical protein VMM13_06475 [Euzebya sp.]|nr:hypothetical protein [Euzebya sp.]
MDDRPVPRPRAPMLRGVGVALVVVVLVGVLVRSPATVPLNPTVGPLPTGPFLTGPAADPSPADPTEEATRESLTGQRGGLWTTIGTRAPIDLLRLGPGVWSGRELLVGFTPAVAAYTPDRRSSEAWRSLPPHPAGALQVRGAMQLPGGPVVVYGQKTCAGCLWEAALFALDPDTGAWERLADAPGEVSQDREVALGVGGQVVVVRHRGAEGIQVLAYDPDADSWRDLQAPDLGPLRWQAVAAGDQVVVVGVIVAADGTAIPLAMAHDPGTGAWRDVAAGMPLPNPHETTAVWTGQEVLLFGGSVRDGAPRGAALSLADDTWTTLPDLPLGDQLLPTLGGEGPLTGLLGVWDGEGALFVGGLIVPLFLAWTPDLATWEVRRATTSRAGGTAVWTGRQLLLWGGTDRRGPVVDLQAWPVRPFGR